MFQTLRRIFSRIRFVIGGIQSALYGLAMVAITWIVALPPSQSEIARLSLAQDATVAVDGLRHYRIAKLLVLVATENTYEQIAARSGTGVSGADFQLAIQIAANGDPISDLAPPQNGARFVSARAN
jgi:hypothetical protein